MLGEFVLQTLMEIMGNAFDTSRMEILQCGLAVLVVSSQDACGKYIVRVMLKIVVADDAIILGRIRPFQPFLILGQSLLGIVLLNDDQVAPCLGVGVLLEQIVRQTKSGNKVGLLKEVVDPDTVLFPVEVVLVVMNATMPPSRTASSPFCMK